MKQTVKKIKYNIRYAKILKNLLRLKNTCDSPITSKAATIQLKWK